MQTSKRQSQDFIGKAQSAIGQIQRDDSKIGTYLLTLLIELPFAIFRFFFFFFLYLTITFLPAFFILLLRISNLVGMRSDWFVDSAQYIFGRWLTTWALIGGLMCFIAAFGPMLWSALSFIGGRSGLRFTRFVLGAREMSVRERETYVFALEQVARRSGETLQGFTGPFVVDTGPLGQVYTIGTTLYLSAAALRSEQLPLLVAHEVGLQQRNVGGMIYALRSLVFFIFYLFVGRVRNWSTGAGGAPSEMSLATAAQVVGSGLSASDTFFSMINTVIFFLMAAFGGGLGVWFTSPRWAAIFRRETFLADDFVVSLGWRQELLEYLEQGLFYDTSVPYMMAWQPANELRIDRILNQSETTTPPQAKSAPTQSTVPPLAQAQVGHASQTNTKSDPPKSYADPSPERARGVFAGQKDVVVERLSAFLLKQLHQPEQQTEESPVLPLAGERHPTPALDELSTEVASIKGKASLSEEEKQMLWEMIKAVVQELPSLEDSAARQVVNRFGAELGVLVSYEVLPPAEQAQELEYSQAKARLNEFAQANEASPDKANIDQARTIVYTFWRSIATMPINVDDVIAKEQLRGANTLLAATLGYFASLGWISPQTM